MFLMTSPQLLLELAASCSRLADDYAHASTQMYARREAAKRIKKEETRTLVRLKPITANAMHRGAIFDPRQFWNRNQRLELPCDISIR
jgi:hypothetical protein